MYLQLPVWPQMSNIWWILCGYEYDNHGNIVYSHTVVVLRIMSTSSLSSGTTSSIKRGMVGTTGGGVINAAFLALKRNLWRKAAITLYMSKCKPSWRLLKPHTPLFMSLCMNLYKPFLLAFLSWGILLILSIFDGRGLFRHRGFFLLLLLLFARSWLLEYFKVGVWVHL